MMLMMLHTKFRYTNIKDVLEGKVEAVSRKVDQKDRNGLYEDKKLGVLSQKVQNVSNNHRKRANGGEKL